MVGLIARVPWAVLLLIWLGLAVQSNAATKDTANMYAHAYERIWLWQRYNMAIAMETKDKKGKTIDQNEILPMIHQKGGREGIKNKHWDQATGKYEGPLHYNEFMVRLDDRPVDEHGIPPKITAPSGADDLERAAQELVDNRLTENLMVHQINDRFGQSGGGGKVNKGKKAAESRDEGRYQRLFSALNDQLLKWRNDEKSYAKIKEYDTMTKSLTERVVQLRIEDGQRFMLHHFDRTDGRGLDLGDKLVKYKEDSRVPGGPDYERLDLGKTWESYEEDVKNAISEATDEKVQIKNFKDFEAWVTDYGNPDGRFAKQTNASPTHFRTIQMWKAIDEGKTC
ncbi:uncharacterized protein KD926_004591 [Aspergillus affinis]|uniref:uncharacterized protein n=1 Tax=Aspergillus affinis TaxID=1070780 RepID=UPI0022FE40F1|nr:uncharacterized protein KD926_004591 [Aspergillus affinis]KAI9043088.1 hypothetical protein KD926_004591 [Aspergillus affinis]